MVRILKAVVTLAILALIGLAGYAYLADLSPQRSEIRVPVDINVGN